MITRYVTLLISMLAAASITLGQAPPEEATEPASDPLVVTTEFSSEEVWVGQGADLIIKLWAPGPFSGTANFDFPRIPGTTLIRQGNPTIGSETKDGVEYFTQRHRFRLYTQQVGAVTIPAFGIQFEAKRSFTGDPEPFEGTTDPISFEAKRPPGTEELEHVVSATSLSVNQTWSPNPEDHEFNAGDILTRTITRKATGTSAMMLAPFPETPINGVRLYPGQPKVTDKTDRGTSSAERVDVIKYQFEHGGTFELPSFTFSWWQPESEEVKTETFAGTKLKVAGPRFVISPKQKRQLQWAIPIAILALLAAIWFSWKPMMRRIKRRREWNHRPEATYRRALLKACRSNDAAAAQSVYLHWKASTVTDLLHGREYQKWFGQDGHGSGLKKAVAQLAEHLYAAEPTSETWDGEALRVTFLAQKKAWLKHRSEVKSDSSLAALNPV